MSKPRYKFRGRAPVPAFGLGYSGPILVWGYTWTEVDENDVPIHKDSFQYWHVDLYWRGLNRRPQGEAIPEESIFRGVGFVL